MGREGNQFDVSLCKQDSLCSCEHRQKFLSSEFAKSEIHALDYHCNCQKFHCWWIGFVLI